MAALARTLAADVESQHWDGISVDLESRALAASLGLHGLAVWSLGLSDPIR
jgi:hypothetical protein